MYMYFFIHLWKTVHECQRLHVSALDVQGYLVTLHVLSEALVGRLICREPWALPPTQQAFFSL